MVKFQKMGDQNILARATETLRTILSDRISTWANQKHEQERKR